jgi:hypothetical protein
LAPVLAVLLGLAVGYCDEVGAEELAAEVSVGSHHLLVDMLSDGGKPAEGSYMRAVGETRGEGVAVPRSSGFCCQPKKRLRLVDRPRLVVL